MGPPEAVTRDGRRLLLERAWPGRRGRLRVRYVDGDAHGSAWVGEHDPVAPGDGLELRPAGVDDRLPGLAASLAGGGVLVGHRPGRRVVLAMPDGAYRKVVRPGRARELAALHERLRALLDGIARVPRVLAVTDEWLDLEPLAGVQLGGSLVVASVVDPAPWRAAGRVLARLAAADPAGLEPRGLAEELAGAVRWWAAARGAGRFGGVALPPLLDPGSTEGGAYARAAAAGDPGLVVGHGDLHDGQLLWDGESLAVLDADTLAAAEPALDLANLLAHLELRQAQGRLDRSARAAAVRAILVGAAPDAPTLERVELLARPIRLRLAAAHALRPAWPGVAEALLGALGEPIAAP